MQRWLSVLANKNSLHRRLRIVELVRKRGEVSVDELATAFDVSSVTIRSDLNYLEQQRYLIRAFGKARYVAQRPGENVLSAVPASATRQAADMAIARLAADFIDDHASVFIGAGVITHKLLPLLADRSNLALTLNDISMVPTVQRFVRCELRLSGGSLDDDSTVLLGPDAERSLSALSLDLVVLEAMGFDREGNLLCADPRLADVYKAALKNAKRIVVVAYQPALQGEGKMFCHVSRLGGLVLDDAIDPPTLDLILKAGLDVNRREEGILEFRNQQP
ncbi:Transcriptional repressor of aga operon [Caballeronia sordidicola]|uniref:Transcriptional repressor of aga operon n=1 Tax=Caballeronia sordidicola TaxID=196367 RepID=A0A242MHJ6_CABSO|nr:Transcriptional repressor of aga operon [Caballeronia sordidicola]